MNPMKQTKYFLLLISISIAIFTSSPANAQAPSSQQTDAARNKPCADPWINISFQQLGYGTPAGFRNSGDCNIALYNSGSWRSFDELKSYVKKSHESLAGSGYRYVIVKLNDASSKYAVAIAQGSSLISQDGGSLISQDGGSVITNTGANFVTSTASFNNLPVASVVPINQRTVFSADKTIIKLGASAIVFARR